MPKKKTTASGLLFENAVEVMRDMFDFTVDRHNEDVDAMEVYINMREAVAKIRRSLRALLKKRWFKGPERERCLSRARELREAELAFGYLIRANKVTMQMNAAFLENAKDFEGMSELMSHFNIKPVDGKKK